MLSESELALFRLYGPLIEAELARLGISEADRRWIFGGSDQAPTAESFESLLGQLRALPNGMGPVAFCSWLGFDYAAVKAELAAVMPPET